ncbi:AraC family transcriptional regulator [Promicromonospora sp. AC04]|uniref:AraC family transcriptional regulator n=1 Tax=Promicromonospora sp. AC04 TaxID=2135723 RepID=UPI001E586F77|nr:AraC family transcriptional regulator [Promicromonospora sp. AC04]
MRNLEFLFTGYEERTSEFDLSAPKRDYHVVHFVLSGRGHCYMNDEHFEIGANQCFVIPADISAIYHADPRDPWTYCWVAFTGADAPALLAQCGFSERRPVLSLPTVSAVKDIVMAMLQVREVTLATQLRVQSWFLQMIAIIAESSHAALRPGEYADNAMVRKAVVYIERHVADRLTVNDIASALFISREYLFILFKRHVGVTPQRFILRTKMSQAQELLVKTDLPVKEIAAACGYGSLFAFSRAFSREIGCPPSDYRRQRPDAT